jgi:hypothetical protein
MTDLCLVVKRRRYTAYYSSPELLEPIFNLFLRDDDAGYAMRDISQQTNVPITTLYSWRERVRVDPTWRPSKEHFTENSRVFPDDIEETIANFIRINFVQPGRSLTRATLRPLILLLIQDLVAQTILPSSCLNFTCSYHFLSRFLRRVGLSFRKARAERRPAISDAECAVFMSDIFMAFRRYPPSNIVNFDESNWRLVMSGEQTVAERGAETVHQYTDGDCKANFSFFATIAADGTKFPLILIARGKTLRCHRQFGKHPMFEYKIWHSESGWCTEGLMLSYLAWLRSTREDEPLCLVMDQYTTHTTDRVEAEADRLQIDLIYVPKGATGRYQPLDRCTFGALKSKGRAKWLRYFGEHYGNKCDKEIAARLLLESWHELSEAAVLAGWDYHEGSENSDDDESDDSDDGFELRVDTDSDDEDEIELVSE